MKTKVTSIRLSYEQAALIARAAKADGVPVSNWIVQQAVVAARVHQANVAPAGYHQLNVPPIKGTKKEAAP